MNSELKIEVTSKDRYWETLMISGLSVKDMKYILDGNGDGKKMDDRLCETMNRITNSTMYDAWRYGYGIYSVRHVGGHLLVQVGNNCD